MLIFLAACCFRLWFPMLALCSDLCARVPGGAPAPRRFGPAELPGAGRGSGLVRSEGGAPRPPRPPRPPAALVETTSTDGKHPARLFVDKVGPRSARAPSPRTAIARASTASAAIAPVVVAVVVSSPRRAKEVACAACLLTRYPSALFRTGVRLKSCHLTCSLCSRKATTSLFRKG